MKDFVISGVLIMLMLGFGKILSLLVTFILANPITLIPLGIVAVILILKI